MNSKNFLPIRIMHLILLVTAFAANVVALISSGSDTTIYGASTLAYYVPFANIVALLASFIYLILGYKKGASSYYRITLGLITFAQALYIVNIANTSAIPIYQGIIQVLSLIILAQLATAKDLGEKNTMILVIVLVICKMIALIVPIWHIPDMGNGAITIISNNISGLLSAGTAGIMAMAKYQDKDNRDAL